MEKQMEKQKENDMETGIMQWLLGVDYKNLGSLSPACNYHDILDLPSLSLISCTSP